MASDEDYMSFLDKANQDPSAGLAKSAASTKHEFKTTDSDVHVPAVLKSVVKDAFYTSDADEPFVPVCLRWNEDGKGLPDEGTSHIVSFTLIVAIGLLCFQSTRVTWIDFRPDADITV